MKTLLLSSLLVTMVMVPAVGTVVLALTTAGGLAWLVLGKR